MAAIDDYQPARPEWCELWKLFPKAIRQRRFRDALLREAKIKTLAARTPGESERAASKRIKAARANLRRWQQRYDKYGFDGLVDWRRPPGASPIPPEMRAAACTLRRADPNVSVSVIVEHLAKHHQFVTSETTVKRVLREEGLARRRGPSNRAEHSGEQHLELGGMKLVEVALEETGYLKALSTAVFEQLAKVEPPESPEPVDRTDRDERGRFLSSYNDRFRKGSDDAIGPGFASIDSLREGLDPSRLHATGARKAIIERKLLALMTSPMLGGGRWDGIRTARGAWLEELCGFPYMPSTLDLFSRELKYVGVASTLWEVHARLWLSQTAAWGTERKAAVVLYIDETNKPVWTELFSQCSKVSNVGRVMPSLESVCFHSGFGVPLWMVTHSGRAPLVKVVPQLLTQFSELHDQAEVGRLVIIDAEGNSVPFLKQLEQGEPARAWVTRFKPSLLKGKRIFNRTRYRPYREGDQIRMGLVDLNDPEQRGQTFRVQVIEVKRRSKGTVTYLGASMQLAEQDWEAPELADLYFARWPNQEANFRAVNQALGLKQVHGYGKQLVDNVSVITKLDELDQKIHRTQAVVAGRSEELKSQRQQLHEQQKQLHRLEQRQETLTRHLQDRITGGQRITPKLRETAREQKAVAKELRKQAQVVSRSESKTTQLSTQLEHQQQQLKQHQERKQLLEPRRHIFQHDTELDSLFSVLKVGLVLIVQFVLRQYLGAAHMEASTFLERVATLPARLRVLPQLEILTFAYNQRDPDVMALLSQHCDAINARSLHTRSGRILRIQVDPAPPPARPPPKRTKSRDRFNPI